MTLSICPCCGGEFPVHHADGDYYGRCPCGYPCRPSHEDEEEARPEDMEWGTKASVFIEVYMGEPGAKALRGNHCTRDGVEGVSGIISGFEGTVSAAVHVTGWFHPKWTKDYSVPEDAYRFLREIAELMGVDE